MAKKEKSLEKIRKSYKRRGIFYVAVICLLIIAAIVLSINSVSAAVYDALYPKSVTITIDGTKREVLYRTEEVDEFEVVTYYYIDDDGNEVTLPSGMYNNDDGSTTLISAPFSVGINVKLGAIRAVYKGLLVLFIILFAIYLLRLSYYLSNKDEEWKKQAGDKVINIRVKFDKLSTNIGSKLKKKNKK